MYQFVRPLLMYMVGMYSVHIPLKITISRYVRASYRRHIERDFRTVWKHNEKNKVNVYKKSSSSLFPKMYRRTKKFPNRRSRWTTKKIKRKHPQNSSAANFLQQSPIYHLHQIPTESPNYDGSGRKKVGLIVSCA